MSHMHIKDEKYRNKRAKKIHRQINEWQAMTLEEQNKKIKRNVAANIYVFYACKRHLNFTINGDFKKYTWLFNHKTAASIAWLETKDS